MRIEKIRMTADEINELFGKCAAGRHDPVLSVTTESADSRTPDGPLQVRVQSRIRPKDGAAAQAGTEDAHPAAPRTIRQSVALLIDLFDEIDGDSDGMVSKEELRAYLAAHLQNQL